MVGRMWGGPWGTPWLAISLVLVLLLSLGINVLQLVRATGERTPHVVSVTKEGPTRQPTLFLDFSAPMVPPGEVDRPLPAGLIRVEPPVANSARFVTPRRLMVQVERPLGLFQHARVTFGPGFCDASGRTLGSGAGVGFTTGQLELRRPPQARFGGDGQAICTLEFNGPVAPNVLREHLLVVDPRGHELAYEFEGEEASWKLTLERAPADGAVLHVLQGLRSRLGPAGLVRTLESHLHWPTTLRAVGTEVTGTHPSRTLALTFSHVLARADVMSFVTVIPRPDDLEVTVKGAMLMLTGSFPPRQVARIHVRSGLAAAAGMILEEDLTRSIHVPPPEPSVRFGQGGCTLSAAARPEITIEGINVPVVEVTLQEVYANNIVPLALRWERSEGLSAPEVTKQIRIGADPDETWKHTLDLADLCGKPPRGVYHLEVSNPESYWGSATRLLQITDLAPVVRVTPSGMVVFVSRLSDGAPVPDAKIQAIDAKNQPCAAGTTDAFGLFVVDRMASTPFVVTITTDDDRAFVDLRTHAVAHAPKDIEGRSTPDGLEAYVYADRGVVRPGETAHLAVLVRTPDGAAAPENLPITMRLRAPDRRVVKRLTGRLDTHGMTAADLPFALDAPTGPYVLEALSPGDDEPIGRVAFRVEAILPDRLEPTLSVPAHDLRPGAKLDIRLAATLLNGDPIGGLPARLRVRYRPVFDAEGQGHTFGDRFAAPTRFTGPEVQQTLDVRGEAIVSVELPAVTRAGMALEATFELEVIDVSGRAAFTRVARRIVPEGLRLGLALPADGPLVLEARSVGGESAECRAVLERIRTVGSWHLEGSRSVWRGEDIPERVAEAAFRIARGQGRVRFPDPGNGRYRVRIEADGAAPAAVGFERWDGETCGLSAAGAPRLGMSLLDGPIRPGQTASLAVNAPIAGRALLTVESSEFLAARVVSLEAGPQRLQVSMPEIAVPNVHVTLTLVRGVRGAGEQPARLLGALAIPLSRPARRLAVSLEMPPQAEPESELELRVRTSAPATLRIHVVDEGVLRLTGYRTPNPLARLEATRRLDTKIADIYATLVERMHFGGDDAESGGGANLAARLDPTAKKTIETVALASQLVQCEREATVSFMLPAYEGRLRVFVVAAGAEGTGATARSLIVKGPISVAIHVPRAVAPGDVFDVPIQVRGDQVTWDLDLEGLERMPQGDGVRVRAGPAPGVAKITVRARDAAGHSVTRTSRLSIRPAAPFTVMHRVLRIAAGERLDGRVPGAWLPGHAQARIVLGQLPGLETLPALERLLEYPHGCIEQTTSRGFSVLAWSELLRATHPEGLAPEDIVGAAIDRVLSMQTSEGGLAFWPGGRVTYDFGSTFGAHFLLEAKRLGRAVPKEPLNALLSHLEGQLHRGCGSAYSARVLALGGRSVAAYLEPLARGALTVEDRADVAAAFLLTGDGQRARSILGQSADPWGAPREQGGRLSSPVRTAATLLGALVDVAPEDPRIPDLVGRLQAEMSTGHGTTQDNAATLLALARFHAQRSAGPAAQGRLTVSGRERVYEGDGLHVEFDPGSEPAFVVEAEGPTTVVLRVSGIPLEPQPEMVERGMTVTRRIEAPQGALKQGRVYRVVIEGRLPAGAENVLITDVLPGGLEIEAARDQEGTLEPDRIEPRDDRVLFFRTQALPTGVFRQTYLVRAVTTGTFRVPPVSAELLYAPELHARSGGGGTIEVVR